MIGGPPIAPDPDYLPGRHLLVGSLSQIEDGAYRVKHRQEERVRNARGSVLVVLKERAGGEDGSDLVHAC